MIATLITISTAVVLNLIAAYFGGIPASIFAAGITLGGLLMSSRPLTANHFGEPRLFGWRAPAWMTVKIGWCLWPGSVFEFTVERIPFSGKAVFFASEDLQLSEPWYMECRIDPRIVDERGRIKYLGVKNFPQSASQFMSSKLAKIGGVSTREYFKELLKEVEDYLRCAVMLSKPPHDEDLEHSKGESPVLGWYKTNRTKVKNLFEKKASSSDERSGFEESYGVLVEVFRLEDPEYTEKTTRDLEEVRQQKARKEAAQHQLQLAKDFQDGLDISGEEALDAAQVAVLGVRKEIHAVRGQGALPLLNLASTQSGGQAGGSKRKGGKP